MSDLRERIEAAVEEYRRVYPEPWPLSPNLSLAVEALGSVPYLIEWATKAENEFSFTEFFEDEDEARDAARTDRLRLFRIEWTEMEA